MSDRAKPPPSDNSLEPRVAALEEQVATLETEVAAQGDAIVALTERVAALEDTEEIIEPPPVIEPPPETGTEITTFQVKNTGNNALANPQISFAHPLAPGAVASDQHVVLQLEDGTVVHCQQDQESTWKQDGSWKVPVLSFVHPGTIPAGSTVTYRLYAGTGAPNRYPAVTLEGLAAHRDFKVRFSGFDLGADIFTVSVNDIIAQGTNWPWGDNPMMGYEVVRAGPVCCEWRFWSFLRRTDGAWHKWLKGWIYVRAWSPTGPFEVAAGVRQSNILGPSPEGTIGAEPEPKHVFDVEIRDGETVIHHWGGPNDPRVQNVEANSTNFPGGEWGNIHLPKNNALTNNSVALGGMAVTLAGAVGDGLSTDTMYWIMSYPEYPEPLGPNSLHLSRYNGTMVDERVIYTTPGSGTISFIPHCHCYPFTGQMYLAPDARPFWGGGTTRPTLAIKHDFNYLTQVSKALPPYIDGIPVSDIPPTSGMTHSPGQQFYDWSLNITGAGPTDERISYLTLTEARALYNPYDEVNNQRARVMAATFAEQHIYMEDEISGMIPVLNNGATKDGARYPGLGVCRPGIRFFPYHNPPLLTPSSNAEDYDGLYEAYGQYMGQASHCPLPGQIPYLQTGDDYWREYMLQLANVNVGSHIVGSQPVSGITHFRPVSTTATQTRGIAWMIRIMAQTKHFMPASHPLAAYWSDVMQDNAEFIDAWWQVIAPLDGEYPSNGGTTANYSALGMPAWWVQGVWQNDLCLFTMGMEAWRNEFPGWAGFINGYYYKSVVGRYDPAVGNGGCTFILGQRNLFPWAGNSIDDAGKDVYMTFTNWDDIFINEVSSVGSDTGLPDPWACPPTTLCGDPGGSNIWDPNSLVNYGTSGLAMWAMLDGGSHAVDLYNEIRSRQYAVGLNFTNFPNWAIGPVGNQEKT